MRRVLARGRRIDGRMLGFRGEGRATSLPETARTGGHPNPTRPHLAAVPGLARAVRGAPASRECGHLPVPPAGRPAVPDRRRSGKPARPTPNSWASGVLSCGRKGVGREPACKPGSVGGSHSSGTRVAARLVRPTRERRGPRLSLPYLVLLRVGFTLPPVLPPARCALTAPFHPYPRSAGGMFSVALSVGSRPPGVTWHPALRSPDFPPRRETRRSGCPADSRRASIHLTVPLRNRITGSEA